MGRPPKAVAATDEAPIADASPKMVLKKNHGFLVNGRVSKFYPAGTEFDPEADAHTVAALIRTGAIFE